jgi:hypothetical protein
MNKQSIETWLKKMWSGPNRKQTLVILALTLVTLFFLGNTFLAAESGDDGIPTTKVKRGAVTIKITESGELRAQDQITISAVTDKQMLWLAPEGAWVDEGDTLIIFESEKYLISKGEAESGLLVAKADLVRAQSDLEAQRAKEEAAKKNFEALPELAKKGFVQENEVEQARLAYLELRSKSRSMSASVDAARANVERAERAVAQQDRKLRQGVVLAPRAGLVVYAMTGDAEAPKKISVGMTPFEGMDLMYLPNVSTMMVDTEISEVDLAKLRLGLPVEIRLDAYTDVVFNGEVVFIADLAKRKISRVTGKATGAKVFDVTVKVIGEDKRLKPGLTATLDLIVNEYANELFIPLEAVFVDEQDQTVVYVKNRNDISVRAVHILESNDRVAVVKEGLQDGDEVLLNRPSAL